MIRALLALFFMGLSAWASASFAQGPPAVPELSPEEINQITTDTEEQTTVSLPADAAPEFVVPVADLLAVGTNFQRKDTLVTFSLRPMRAYFSQRWVWGFGLLGTYQSDKDITTFGVSYRLEPRWVADKQLAQDINALHAAGFAGVKMPENLSDAQKREWSRREMLRRVDGLMINLLPVLTVGYQIGLFASDLDEKANKDVARQSIPIGLDWHYGPYVEYQGTFSWGRERENASDKTYLIKTVSVSSVAMVLLPQLIGTTYYDDYYLKNLFQRGIGIGPIVTYKECLEDGEHRADCPKGGLWERLVGAAVDIRLTKDITPRFVIGQRKSRKFEAGESTDDEDSVEGGVQLVYRFQ